MYSGVSSEASPMTLATMSSNKGHLRGHHEDDALEVGKSDFPVLFLPQSLSLGMEVLPSRAGVARDGKCLLEIGIHLHPNQHFPEE